MSETAKARVVLCSKCGNLLPEVADCSVHECGGCGAVLRAKNKGVDLDSFSMKSDEERVGNAVDKVSDRYENMKISDKRLMNASDGSESDVSSSISSSSRAERRRILRDRAEKYRNKLMNKDEKWKFEDEAIEERKSNEFQKTKISEDLTMNEENENVVWRSGQLENGRHGEESETNCPQRAPRRDPDVPRYGKASPSDHLSRSSYEYENPLRDKNDFDGLSNGDSVGEDRTQLLKRLDKDQISKSGDLIGEGKGKVPLDGRMDPCSSENWLPDSSSGMNRESMPCLYPDAQFRRSPYPYQYAEPPPPLMHRQETDGNGFYPLRYGPDYYQGYVDHLRFGRSPLQASAPYPHLQSHLSGSYMDEGMAYMDPMEPYPPNLYRHHPSCACLQCHNKRQAPIPPLFHPIAYSDRYSVNYHDNYGLFGSRDYHHSLSNSQSLTPHDPHSHMRWPSDVNSESDGFARRRLPRVRLSAGGQSYRPIAGGAPFLTCWNCFELLVLPKKVLPKNETGRKLICGACSTIIVFAVSDRKLVVSVDVEETAAPVNVDGRYGLIHKHDEDDSGYLNGTRSTFSSEDCLDSGYDFQSMDRETGKISSGTGRGEKFSNMDSRPSASFYGSEVEENMGSPIAAIKELKRPPAGSSLQEYFEYSNVYHAANGCGNGTKSEEDGSVFPKKATIAPSVLRKDSSVTEIDLSSNEYCNTGTTFDSGEASRGDGGLKGNGAKSIFAVFRNKNAKDSNRSHQYAEQEVANVTVNGHIIPDQLVKKAECKAGPIGPGHYWYDFRAGFWGVMGGPCRGIIPPFIDEFGYPMPEHCAAGNTRVLVNGRELNNKDLKLLASRGLPTERDRSYVVEISGRVLDEDTGEELKSLGKLAPTVENNKRGYGMSVPPVAA